MPFSFATAISRLTSGPTNAFKAGLSSAQQLQRVNEVLDRFYELGTWAGVLTTISGLTTTAGVLSLPSSYIRLDGLSIPAKGEIIPIKSQEWAFSEAGPGMQDWTQYGELVAIDQGDTNGVRTYQLTGDPSKLDLLVLAGLARKRYTWVTDTATIIVPDSYQAIRLGVIALGWEDEGDNGRYQATMDRALGVLNGNYDQSESDTEHGVVAVEMATSMGQIRNLN